MKPVQVAAAVLLLSFALPAFAKPQKVVAHDVVIFVADGLRSASVTPDIAPTFSRLRRAGVDFTNSHSLYPTVTTANASHFDDKETSRTANMTISTSLRPAAHGVQNADR